MPQDRFVPQLLLRPPFRQALVTIQMEVTSSPLNARQAPLAQLSPQLLLAHQGPGALKVQKVVLLQALEKWLPHLLRLQSLAQMAIKYQGVLAQFVLSV